MDDTSDWWSVFDSGAPVVVRLLCSPCSRGIENSRLALGGDFCWQDEASWFSGIASSTLRVFRFSWLACFKQISLRLEVMRTLRYSWSSTAASEYMVRTQLRTVALNCLFPGTSNKGWRLVDDRRIMSPVRLRRVMAWSIALSAVSTSGASPVPVFASSPSSGNVTSSLRLDAIDLQPITEDEER
jgi:hypothetical protein